MNKLLNRTTIFLCVLFFSATVHAVPPHIQGQILVDASVAELAGYQVLRTYPITGISVVQVVSGQEWGQIQKLRKKGFKAGYNVIVNAAEVPSDSLYPYQWHMNNIQMESAWDITKGAGAKVAVLDSGIVALNAPDGVNLCPSGHKDIVNNDDDPTDGSDTSHGTHVAGTIAQNTSFTSDASPKPAVGTVGVAPEACVLVVKVLNDAGSGSMAEIAEGIAYAVSQGANVINMSLGVNARFGITSDPFVDPELDLAEANNVLVVAAAGNDGHRKNVSYPAIYDTVVAVGATDFRDNIVRYSNRGTGLDIVAPGGDTGSDQNGDGYADGVLQETYDATDGYGYYFFQGTSMASPHVAGVGALLYANGLTQVEDVRQALFSSALDLGNVNFDSSYGYGLVQAADALNGGNPTVDTPPNAPSNPTPTDSAINVSINPTLTWSADSDATNDIYLSTTETFSDTPTATNVGTSYAPSTLSYNTTYSWKVVSTNLIGTTESSIWYFTTEAEPTGGTLTDADGDGYYAEVDDCDDSNSHVYPGHNDTKGRWGKDGVDNDCNGVIDG